MIDFIRFNLPIGKGAHLLRNPLLEFSYHVITSTGEIRSKNRKGNPTTPRQIAYHKDFQFKIFDTGLTVIEGSLH